MELSEEMRAAWRFIEHTDTSIFLTGKAGTGKTTFLRYVVEHTSKSFIVCAPTGVAAVNAGGVTIHSFFQLPLSPYVAGAKIDTRYNFSKEKLRIIRSLDLVIIDEISMVRSDLLDAMDACLRRYRHVSKPFGGVQLLMIGDLRQLAPVVTRSDEVLLRESYYTPFFFGSKALSEIEYVTLSLSRVFRQKDDAFLRILNHLRDNIPDERDFQMLNARWQPHYIPQDEAGYIRLTTHNSLASEYNESRMRNLPGRAFSSKATVKGNFPESSFPTDVNLTLKQGAQVMFLKNDSSGEHRYYNGKLGIVIGRGDEGSVRVRCLDDNKEVELKPEIWENNTYTIDEETNLVVSKVEGTFTQIPLRPAWAITIHKSQGLTFDYAVIDADASFAPGQVYVALSRCRTLDGLVLATPISRSVLFNDPKVSEFIQFQNSKAAGALQSLQYYEDRYVLVLLKDLFNFSRIGELLYLVIRMLEEKMGAMGAEVAEDLRRGQRLMQEKVTDIALRWSSIMDQYGAKALLSGEESLRLRRGAEYFHAALADSMAVPVATAAKHSTANKAINKRYKELSRELAESLTVKLMLLSFVKNCGFSVGEYLMERKKATLRASGVDVKKKTVSKTRQRRRILPKKK